MVVRSSNWSHDGRPRNAVPVASMRAHGLVIVPDDADGVDGAALDHPGDVAGVVVAGVHHHRREVLVEVEGARGRSSSCRSRCIGPGR
jgi:hypothetical protein